MRDQSLPKPEPEPVPFRTLQSIEEHVEELRQRDPNDALDFLYRYLIPPAVERIARFFTNRSDAENVVEEAYLELLLDFEEIQVQTSWGRYFHGITNHKLSDYHDALARRARRDWQPPDHNPTPEELFKRRPRPTPSSSSCAISSRRPRPCCSTSTSSSRSPPAGCAWRWASARRRSASGSTGCGRRSNSSWSGSGCSAFAGRSRPELILRNEPLDQLPEWVPDLLLLPGPCRSWENP